ncbi:hypothetical protein [Ciceribacter sp. L1K22]|uniref:hypothetical protein n=1 Tax=Ciceribacter sp. L1K22 TaxID=2820275 RepID=UPI001ABEBF71|nr:hypothetical protein [Ciceribacter sp. L1K22]MBO3760453.1 hypothetical protein [Ciceribacter sp. L1K22]
MSDIQHNTARPGTKKGVWNEFTVIMPLKPGGAERMRAAFGGFDEERTKNTDRIGTVHDLRFVIFDNDTRCIFASTFDGDWETYIDDFATIIPDEIDLLFSEVVDYPGVRSPAIKDFIAKHQVSAMAFYGAYTDASVRDVWKALKIRKALDQMLDAAN